MARNDALNWPDGAKMIGVLVAASILLQHGTWGQQVKVEGEVLSYPGQTVNLRCSFPDVTGVQLTMVSWLYEPKDGTRQNIAVLHPNHDPSYPDSPLKGRVSFTQSPPSLSSPSIQITGVQLTDEGKYICEYATYPGGNQQGITQLVMLAKPQNSATSVTVLAGAQPVVVARCTSANGRPPATIKWVTTADGNATMVSSAGSDNTVTVTSEYSLAPKSSDNGKDISCLVDHRTQAKTESIPLKLAVQYAPEVRIEGYDNNWYIGRTNAVLICQANGNPIPTSITWKAVAGAMPDTVQITQNELKVLKVDESVNTTFVCEVKNGIGTSKEQVAVFVRVHRLPEKGPATGGIIGGIIAVIVILVIIGTGIAMWRKYANKKLNGDGPPKYKPPPPTKINSSKLNPAYTPVNYDRTALNQFYATQSPEPVTDLDAHPDDVDDHDPGTKDGQHYISASPSGWDDPGNDDALPPYSSQNIEPHDYNGGINIGREESFVSPPMIV
uniref:Poliovirus receptor-related 2 (Herpesvirus entry mediator B) n=1 Tax=Nothobranchius kuhntae TaxID=321403 RepID=A0A1A8IGS1_NOTKU